MSRLKNYAFSILIPVFVGILVGLVTSSSMDYEMLQKPFLSPPGWVFPVVWTILYILMGISYGILKEKQLVDGEIDRIYYSQLIVNALWSIIFFNLKWRLFAFIWIILLIILVITMIKEFYEKNKTSGLLQIPYLAWILFAAYLNLGFFILNK